jgi:hypothetical protein
VNFYAFVVFMDALEDGSTRSVGAQCDAPVPALGDFRMRCAAWTLKTLRFYFAASSEA